MVRCLWHKDWDYINIHWNFNAEEHLNAKTVVWSVPRDVPLDQMHIQFNGLSEALFNNASVHKIEVTQDTEL